jgi:hypothetical protein
MAWLREGGDKTHTTGVHFQKEVWTRAFKQRLAEVIKPALRSFIEEASDHTFAFVAEGYAPTRVQEEARAQFAAIHADLRDPDEQRRLFETWRQSYGYMALRDGLDLWCALWFWPPDHLELAPTPTDFHAPSADTKAIVRALRAELRFFHWELEFPDVFNADRGGFDALLGNPPWEIQKPNSKEWFSNEDPLYRSYGKTEALEKQRALFAADINVELRWLGYNSRLKALSNFTKCAAFAFGDRDEHEDFTLTIARGRENAELHRRWRERRAEDRGFAEPAHPYRYQGSADINTYKLFLEASLTLLHMGGRLGFILPSGIYSDKGSKDLRRLLLSRCRWEWLFGMINWKKIFSGIYYRFKFCILVAEKGAPTESVNTAFSRYNLEDWQEAEALRIPFPIQLIERLSPFSSAFVEVRHKRDLEVLDRIYSESVLLGDQSPRGWGLRYASEFHMTNDAELFPPLPKWEARGYRPDEYGHWLRGGWRPCADSRDILGRPVGLLLSRDGQSAIQIQDVEDVAVPLYEGRMIGQFDFSEKGWVSGAGRTADWRDILWERKMIEPQYLISFETQRNETLQNYLKGAAKDRGKAFALEEAARLKDPNQFAAWWSTRQTRVAFMDVTSATNERTCIATYLENYPCGNSVPVLLNCADPTGLVTVLNSFAYDFAARARCSGLHLNYFIIEETPLPVREAIPNALRYLGLRLFAAAPIMCKAWLNFDGLIDRRRAWHSLWAITSHERLRLRIIADALTMHVFGLDTESVRWVFYDCDHARDELSRNEGIAGLNPKGFWRVDKNKDPELRHTVLTQVAFADLQEQGVDFFLAANDGEGWMLPETLRLADYGLGHDARARESQLVAACLGPRFLPWQLDRDPAKSWVECEAHATLLDTLWRHARTLSASREGEEHSLDTAVAGTSPAASAPQRPGVSNRDRTQQTELAL